MECRPSDHAFGQWETAVAGGETGSPPKPFPSCARAESMAPGMSNYSTVDRESFQKLLASAFAVQQSQMDNPLLSVSKSNG